MKRIVILVSLVVMGVAVTGCAPMPTPYFPQAQVPAPGSTTVVVGCRQTMTYVLAPFGFTTCWP